MIETNDYYARLPWASTQERFGLQVPKSLVRATCGWHGTKVNPERGAFAVVRSDGPLVDLVDTVIRVSYTGSSETRSVYVYVTDDDATIFEDVSLARAAFIRLLPLWTEEAVVQVEELTDGG